MAPNPDTGWRRCIGCRKLQVSFLKRATNYTVVLRKVTYKVKHPMHLRMPPCVPDIGAGGYVSVFMCVCWFIYIHICMHKYVFTYM